MKYLKKKMIIWVVLLTAMYAVIACSKDSDSISDSEDITNVSDSTTEPTNSNVNLEKRVIYMLPETRNMTLTNEQVQMVKRSNIFSYELFKAIDSTEEQKGKSLLVSPLSLMYVLGMLNDGALGDTEAEISSLFGLPTASKAAINDYCQALLTQAPQADPSVTLQTTNIVAAAKDITTAQQWRTDIQRYYEAEATSLDFTQPGALRLLNEWCSAKTQGMIPSILDELDPNTRMVLMNAVSFRATWTEKFDPADTRDETFTGEESHTATMPMMHRKAIALYAPTDIYSMLCLPYGSGTQWQMIILLPNEGRTVDDVINSQTFMSWEELWQMNNSRYQVDVKIPRFRAASDIVLNDIVAQMGAPLMFSGCADFSQMTENSEPLNVSLLKQKTAIEVNEEGTKAAAVTAAAMVGATLPPAQEVNFHANRPFVYIIREASSGAVFFIGTFR